MNRTNNMRAYTEGLKAETIRKVQEAIDTIKSTGGEVTRKEILENSGLSSSVLSKPYIKDVFKRNNVLMYSGKKIKPDEIPDRFKVLQHENSVLLSKVSRLESKIQNYEIATEHLNVKLMNANNNYKDLMKKYEMELGKIQKLLEVCDDAGINIKRIGLI